VSDKSVDIKIVSKSCPAETQPINLGLDVRKYQPAEHSKRYKLFKEKIFLRLYSTADVIFGNYKSHRYSPTIGHHHWQILSRFLLQYVHRSLSVGIYLPVILLMVERIVCVRAILFEPSF